MIWGLIVLPPEGLVKSALPIFLLYFLLFNFVFFATFISVSLARTLHDRGTRRLLLVLAKIARLRAYPRSNYGSKQTLE